MRAVTALASLRICSDLPEPSLHADVISTVKSEERGGSVVECLTQDRGVVGSSLTSCTALCP